ncbi:MAG: hypothetical protein OEQ14_08185 [Gammaproteobacteria bacterium]|nr:hypothetical protein [Gammaproteobacteria bacterium]
MTLLAMIFMSVALAGVTVLTAWCYYRVLKEESLSTRSKDQR